MSECIWVFFYSNNTKRAANNRNRLVLLHKPSAILVHVDACMTQGDVCAIIKTYLVRNTSGLFYRGGGMRNRHIQAICVLLDLKLQSTLNSQHLQ